MLDLRGLVLSGASRGDVSGFSSADSLQLETSGASSLSMENVEAGDTRFNISGASRVSGSIEIAGGDFEVSGASTVELEGTAHDVSMDVSGASTVRLADFAVTNAGIELSGVSNATVNVSGKLDVIASGTSTLEYLGNPTLGTVMVSKPGLHYHPIKPKAILKLHALCVVLHQCFRGEMFAKALFFYCSITI